jgi:sugar lactone lactonase YvrE
MDFDAQGNLFVAEWGAGRISRFAPDGARETFAEGLSGPSGLVVSPDGVLFVASYSSNVIWRFSPDGRRSTYATGLATPAGLSFDRSGRLMVANRRTNEILAVENGGLSPVIGGLNTPVGAVQLPDGGFVVSNIGGGVTILRPDGTRIEAGQDFRTPGPGIAMTGTGRVFVVDYGGTTVREILMEGGSRAIADGFSSPVGLVVAPDQRSLLSATWGDSAIFEIPLAS